MVGATRKRGRVLRVHVDVMQMLMYVRRTGDSESGSRRSGEAVQWPQPRVKRRSRPCSLGEASTNDERMLGTLGACDEVAGDSWLGDDGGVEVVAGGEMWVVVVDAEEGVCVCVLRINQEGKEQLRARGRTGIGRRHSLVGRCLRPRTRSMRRHIKARISPQSDTLLACLGFSRR